MRVIWALPPFLLSRLNYALLPAIAFPCGLPQSAAHYCLLCRLQCHCRHPGGALSRSSARWHFDAAAMCAEAAPSVRHAPRRRRSAHRLSPRLRKLLNETAADLVRGGLRFLVFCFGCVRAAGLRPGG